MRKRRMRIATWIFSIAPALLLGAATAGAAEEPADADFVDAVDRVVETLEAEDYEAFEALFVENTKGMQPDQLWRGALGLFGKFGSIETVELGSRDERSGGAFVEVEFERASREVFVRLEPDGKIRELTYVPPMNAH